MKILAFGDIHGDFFALEEVRSKCSGVDLAICLGDLTYFEHDLEFLLQVLNDFPVPVLILHGNHECFEHMDFFCSELKNVTYGHKSIFKKKGYEFICYGGDGFSSSDEGFTRWINKENISDKCVLLLHGPPYGTLLDLPVEGHHSGNKSTRKFIEKKQPLLVLAGHIHECEGHQDVIGKSLLINPGPFGLVIDLDKLN